MIQSQKTFQLAPYLQICKILNGIWQKEGSLVAGAILGIAMGALFGMVFAEHITRLILSVILQH